MATTTEPVGALVRRWRGRRRRTQLDLSIATGVSTRHLSCIETGRARPSPAMIEQLCEELEVPLRERNSLHLAAGYAPAHAERPFTDLGMAGTAVEAVLAGLEPNPALAVDARWDLLAANGAMAGFLGAVPEELRSPPVNVLRATLHPDGLAPRIRNLAQWRAHVLRRVRRQLDRTAVPGLPELLAELTSYPVPGGSDGPGTAGGRADEPSPPGDGLVVPLRLDSPIGELALLYTTTVFGSPLDVTLDEIAIEVFFPADRATAALLRAAAEPVVPRREDVGAAR